MYFEYPWETYEDVKVELPPGMQMESLPGASKVDRGATIYQSTAEKQGNVLQLKRTLKMAAYYVAAERYPVLRQFYEQVRAGDEQQVVLKSGPAPDKP